MTKAKRKRKKPDIPQYGDRLREIREMKRAARIPRESEKAKARRRGEALLAEYSDLKKSEDGSGD